MQLALVLGGTNVVMVSNVLVSVFRFNLKKMANGLINVFEDIYEDKIEIN